MDTHNARTFSHAMNSPERKVIIVKETTHTHTETDTETTLTIERTANAHTQRTATTHTQSYWPIRSKTGQDYVSRSHSNLCRRPETRAPTAAQCWQPNDERASECWLEISGPHLAPQPTNTHNHSLVQLSAHNSLARWLNSLETNRWIERNRKTSNRIERDVCVRLEQSWLCWLCMRIKVP